MNVINPSSISAKPADWLETVSDEQYRGR